MGSLQSAILGFGAFSLMQKFGYGRDFTVAENVIIQVSSISCRRDMCLACYLRQADVTT